MTGNEVPEHLVRRVRPRARLPEMAMGVDEPGHDDHAGRVEDLAVHLAAIDGATSTIVSPSTGTSPSRNSPIDGSTLMIAPPLMRSLFAMFFLAFCRSGFLKSGP